MNLKEEIEKIDKSEWPKIWCTLNRWEFPDQLNSVKPDWWDKTVGQDSMQKKSDISLPIMHLIVNTIGMKVCNREWNKDRMTDEEHEQFWTDSFINNKG